MKAKYLIAALTVGVLLTGCGEKEAISDTAVNGSVGESTGGTTVVLDESLIASSEVITEEEMENNNDLIMTLEESIYDYDENGYKLVDKFDVTESVLNNTSEMETRYTDYAEVVNKINNGEELSAYELNAYISELPDTYTIRAKDKAEQPRYATLEVVPSPGILYEIHIFDTPDEAGTYYNEFVTEYTPTEDFPLPRTWLCVYEEGKGFIALRENLLIIGPDDKIAFDQFNSIIVPISSSVRMPQLYAWNMGYDGGIDPDWREVGIVEFPGEPDDTSTNASYTMSGKEFYDYCLDVFGKGHIDEPRISTDYYHFDSGVFTDDLKYQFEVKPIPLSEVDDKIEFYEQHPVESDWTATYKGIGNDIWETYNSDKEIDGYILIRGNVIITAYSADETSREIALQLVMDNFDTFDEIVNLEELQDLYEE